MIDDFIEFLISLYGKDAYNYVPNMTDVKSFAKLYKLDQSNIEKLKIFVKECQENAKLEEIENDFI
jgi:hypothetical protein